jgi:hypothetical protein
MSSFYFETQSHKIPRSTKKSQRVQVQSYEINYDPEGVEKIIAAGATRGKKGVMLKS